jgi:hypothetical protein
MLGLGAARTVHTRINMGPTRHGKCCGSFWEARRSHRPVDSANCGAGRIPKDPWSSALLGRSAFVQVSRTPASRNHPRAPTTGVREAPRDEIAGRKGLGTSARIPVANFSMCFILKRAKSQAHEGWRLVPDRYDDGGLSGAASRHSRLGAPGTSICAGEPPARVEGSLLRKLDTGERRAHAGRNRPSHSAMTTPPIRGRAPAPRCPQSRPDAPRWERSTAGVGF